MYQAVASCFAELVSKADIHSATANVC